MSNKRYQLFTLLSSSLEFQKVRGEKKDREKEIEEAILLVSKEYKWFGEMQIGLHREFG